MIDTNTGISKIRLVGEHKFLAVWFRVLTHAASPAEKHSTETSITKKIKIGNPR